MLGKLVRTICGHDAGAYYIVIGEMDHSYLLADGIRKKMDCPKRKNRKHVEIVSGCFDEAAMKDLLARPAHGDQRIRETIKNAIKK